MTRQEEIQVLRSLQGDTYFAQFFGNDIDAMCDNISNDFPIEMGCTFNAEREEYARRQKEDRAKTKEWAQGIAEFLIETGDAQATAVKLVGMMNVIKIKRQLDLKLNSEEIDYLIEQAEKVG